MPALDVAKKSAVWWHSVMNIETIDRIDLRTLLCFERVSALGSFAAAGRQLQMPRAAVSRLIQQLEEQVGVKLFHRTTRSVALTDEGQALVDTALPSLQYLRSALLEATATSTEHRGTVSFSVSQAFGRRFVLPALPSFTRQFPAIRLDMSVTDDLDNLVAEGLDFAIRIGELPDSSMVTRKLAELDVVLAVPSKLLTAGTPAVSLDDLDKLPLIAFRIPGTKGLYRWHFERDGQVVTKLPDDAQYTTDSIEDLAQLVCDGAGAAPLPRYLIADQLAEGQIVIGMPDYALPSVPLQLCFPTAGKRPARVDALAEHLTGAIRRGICGIQSS